MIQERQTKQKQIIYDALKTLNHPTATEVYAYVHQNAPTVSRATVFRVLSGYATTGKALELRMAGSEVRYDFNVMPHCHARCTTCGKVVDVQTQALENGLTASNMEGFEITGYTLEFHGLCQACKNERIS